MTSAVVDRQLGPLPAQGVGLVVLQSIGVIAMNQAHVRVPSESVTHQEKRECETSVWLATLQSWALD